MCTLSAKRSTHSVFACPPAWDREIVRRREKKNKNRERTQSNAMRCNARQLVRRHTAAGANVVAVFSPVLLSVPMRLIADCDPFNLACVRGRYVVDQLQCLGILQTCEVLKVGMPTRVTYTELKEVRYQDQKQRTVALAPVCAAGRSVWVGR